MRNPDTFGEYARYRAAGAVISSVSSATDVHLIDVATAVAEGGTGRPFEGEGRWLMRPPLTLGDISSIGAFATLRVGPEGDEESSGNSAALGELRTPEGQIRRQIVSLLAGQAVAYWERLARRLRSLLEAMAEEGETWSDDSPESLRRMMLFLQSQPTLRYPSVTVTPSATFRAQWTADPGRHFGAEFLANGEVRFVVFSPDPRHPDRIQRVSGIESWENLMHVIEPYDVRRWAANTRP